VDLEGILRAVRDGTLRVEEAMHSLRVAPYQDLGFAKVDTYRAVRRGFPEAIFGQGKTPAEVARIVSTLVAAGQRALVTRASPEQYEAVLAEVPGAVYHERARVLLSDEPEVDESLPPICVCSGGTADLPVAEEAALTIEARGLPVCRLYDVGVAGIHRLLDHLEELWRSPAIVVVAGMEGALASVVGGLVDAPVVSVPTSVGYGAHFSGLAPLLAMLNSCAVGTAVVNIDNGFGAGSYAAMIVNAARKLKR